jgi:hypothetical protein
MRACPSQHDLRSVIIGKVVFNWNLLDKHSHVQRAGVFDWEVSFQLHLLRLAVTKNKYILPEPAG